MRMTSAEETAIPGTTISRDLPSEVPPRVNDTEGYTRFIKEQLPLVRRVCWRFRHSGVALEDLFQVGSIGLLRAMKKYDPERGAAFATFAVPVIVGEIKNYFRDHGWAVKVPRKLQMHTRTVRSAVDILRQQVPCRRLSRPAQPTRISGST